MTQTTKYWFTLGLLFLSFGYTADGYQTAAYVFSALALLAAVDAHSIHALKRHSIEILTAGCTASALTAVSGLTAEMPAVWFVVFCGAASCILYEESSIRTLRNTVFCLSAVMLILYLIVLLVPYTVYGTKDTLLLISAAFLPIPLTYLHKAALICIKKSKVRMATNPRMY